MLRLEEIKDVAGRDVYDREDTKIGTAGELFLDSETREPEWLGVQTGLFGMKESFVPLHDAQLREDGLHLPFNKNQVKDAPNINPDAAGLLVEQEQELFSYYGKLGWHPPQEGERKQGERKQGERKQQGGRVDAGKRGDEAMTRSEEQLRAGREKVETGQARLRKYVTTEQQQVTVPVEREEVRIEREPITDANREAATSGPEISEAEQVVTLHEERPVVGKVTEAKERVRLGTESVTEEETVSGEVRKEHIETETAKKGRNERR